MSEETMLVEMLKARDSKIEELTKELNMLRALNEEITQAYKLEKAKNEQEENA